MPSENFEVPGNSNSYGCPPGGNGEAMTQISARLAGRRVLITGASQGIGRAVAIRFAQEGASVIINDRIVSDETAHTLELAKKASRDAGHTSYGHVVVAADIASADDIAGMFEAILHAGRRLDILVNNAGIQSPATSDSFDPAQFEKIIAINLTGAALCSRHALAHFISRPGGGNIISTSSVHQIIPKPLYLSYSMSKAAIGNMTRTLALEYADRGIRVNAVGPGAIVTPINAAWIDNPEARANVEAHIPMGRAGTSEEIAGVFAFLASDEAAYITGQTIYACGGLTLFNEFRNNWAS
jgi:glucose 1-dehydrogenase